QSTMMYLGIEIGGTKLQLGIGPGDGTLAGLWRESVEPAAGAECIRQQITSAVPELLTHTNLTRAQLQVVGIGFGAPVAGATPAGHTPCRSSSTSLPAGPFRNAPDASLAWATTIRTPAMPRPAAWLRCGCWKS